MDKTLWLFIRAVFLLIPLVTIFVSTVVRAGGLTNNTYVMRLQAGSSVLSIADTASFLLDNGSDAYSISDGWAGAIGITVTGQTFSVYDFQIDTTNTAAFGLFPQYAPSVTQMGGVINSNNGFMTFDPTGRRATIDGPSGQAINMAFNIDDVVSGNSAYTTFTTDTITCTDCTSSPTISGSAVTSIADIDGDGIHEHTVQLVSSAYLGGPLGRTGAGYSELWDIIIFSDITGFVQGTPVLPTRISPFNFDNAVSGLWFDPPATTGFTYSMTSGSLFTRILDFPTGFSSDFGVRVGAVDLGLFGSGDLVDFVTLLGTGISEFEIYGINPIVDSADPQAFPLRLEFNTLTASFSMTPTVPVPAAVWLFGSGLLGLIGIARRKKPA